MVLLPYFLWSKCSGSNERNNRQNFQNIFVFDSQWFCPQCYSRYSTLAYSNRKLIRRKMGFLKCKIFYEEIIWNKEYFIKKKKKKKKNYFFMWELLFLVLTQCEKSVFRLHVLTLKLLNLILIATNKTF